MHFKCVAKDAGISWSWRSPYSLYINIHEILGVTIYNKLEPRQVDSSQVRLFFVRERLMYLDSYKTGYVQYVWPVAQASVRIRDAQYK